MSGPAALRAGAEFYRAHGLGNDYLVFEAVPPMVPGWSVGPAAIRRVCDRWRGVGSDGVVVLLDRTPADRVFPLRMFNPDGSEFERSGNGLRVLASYLHGEGLVDTGESFEVTSSGSVIPMTVHGGPRHGCFDVSVEMGKAVVGRGAVRLVASELDPEGRALHPALGPVEFVPVSVGNPHAVVLDGDRSRALEELGPFLATHPAFPDGTNVQLVDELSPGRLRIRIWERGVGRTSASGTSSCAAAAAAVATGRLSQGSIAVEMEGGTLEVSVSDGLEITLRGPVEEVARGRLAPGFLESIT